jgi:Protein of unknown function (DUF3826)
MKTHLLTTAMILSAVTFFCPPVSAQTSAPPVLSTPPVTAADKEVLYNHAIEYRAQKIMEALAMTDSAKSNRVHTLIVAHYHALRARDEAIDAELGGLPQGSNEWRERRNAMFLAMSQPLHGEFMSALSSELTPEQIEKVKDVMTYGKVQFTYNAYCSIVPGLTDDDKAKILDLLKQAREVAMDGGSSGEKSDIFQQYKDQINSYLKTRGIDVDKAIQDWSERQKQLSKSSGQAPAAATTAK